MRWMLLSVFPRKNRVWNFPYPFIALWSRTLESVKRHERFIFNYFWELCCRELYREAIKESMCMVNMLSSTCVAFDGRSLGSWCTLIRKCFSLLWNCMCTVRLSLSRTRTYICAYIRVHDSAYTYSSCY